MPPFYTFSMWLKKYAKISAAILALALAGVSGERFARIEGVAAREPYVPGDIYDPRNRRMSITLGWSGGVEPAATSAPSLPEH